MMRSSRHLGRCSRTLVRKTLRSLPLATISSGVEVVNAPLVAKGQYNACFTHRRYLRTSSPKNPILELATNRQASINLSSVVPYHLTNAASEVHAEYDLKLSQLLEKLKDEPYLSELFDALTSLEGPPSTILNVADIMSTMFMDEPLWNQAVRRASSHPQSYKDHATVTSALQTLEDRIENGTDLWKLVRGRIQTYVKRGVLVTDRHMWDYLTSSEQYLSAVFTTTVEGHPEALGSESEQIAKLDSLISVKQKQAELLGYESYVKQALCERMISRDSIEALLLEVSERALKSKAAAEAASKSERHFLPLLKSLQSYFRSESVLNPSTGMFEVSLASYISLDGALGGLFALSQSLFGIIISEDKNPRGWHSDVRLFHVTNEKEENLGSFYLDPYRREGKKQVSFTRPLTLDIVCISVNVKRSMWEDLKAPLEMQDIEALVLEFGHALRYLMADANKRAGLGRSDSNLDVEEVVPRFLETWVCQDFFLQSIAINSANLRIPDELLSRILEQRRVRKLEECLRQAFLGQLELDMFDDRKGGESLVELQRRLAGRFMPHTISPETDLQPMIQLAEANGLRPVAQYRHLLSEVLSANIFQSLHEANITTEEEMRSFGAKIMDVLLKPGVLVDGNRAMLELCGRKIDQATVSAEAYYNMYKL
ncbi:PFAM Peptidase family M3 [Fragilaria crotonensis]|nr:PFAM Peptidase family M3 [Fragilaria crotonensis]